MKEFAIAERDIIRFWSYVDRRKPDDCWLWTGAKTGKGYGHMFFQGRMHNAHRVSWMVINNQSADGLLILHSCDNPPCVNPAHLHAGTAAENTADMMSKGRHHYKALQGSQLTQSKLSESAVRDIRYLLRHGYTQPELARQHGVSQSTISNVVLRKTWRHVE